VALFRPSASARCPCCLRTDDRRIRPNPDISWRPRPSGHRGRSFSPCLETDFPPMPCRFPLVLFCPFVVRGSLHATTAGQAEELYNARRSKARAAFEQVIAAEPQRQCAYHSAIWLCCGRSGKKPLQWLEKAPRSRPSIAITSTRLETPTACPRKRPAFFSKLGFAENEGGIRACCGAGSGGH